MLARSPPADTAPEGRRGGRDLRLVPAADLGTLSFEPVANWNGTASFTFTVTDSNDDESAAAATVSITVSAVDDRPTASDISKSIEEDTTLTFAASDFISAFSDADGDTLKSVKIATLPNAAHGTIKVGTAAATTRQAVVAESLGTISFEPVGNWNGTASFTFTVIDSYNKESAAAATVSITVNPVDDRPTASDFGKTVNEDTPLPFAAADFTGAFRDADGHTLKSVKIATLPDTIHGTLKVGLADASTGQVVLAGNLGTIAFEPATNWNGTASFTFKVTDSNDEESGNAATVSITVNAVDDAPTASNFGKSTAEDTTLTFAAADFTGAFSDADGDGLKSVKIATLPNAAHGTLKVGLADASTGQVVLAGNLGTLSFEPAANWNGEASFTFKVTDSDNEESAAATTVSITVSAVDDAPTASDISKTIDEDTPLTFAAADFTDAFSDADGHTLKSVKIATLPDAAHGTLKAGDPLAAVSAGDTIAAADLGTLSLEPVSDWSGEASFTFTVIDSNDGESADAATVSITVSAVDDAPTASDISKTIDEDTTLTFAASDFTDVFSDADGDTLRSVEIATLPDGAHGTLRAGDPLAAVSAGDTIPAADLGTLSFEPVSDWNGEASFTFTVIDTEDEESTAAAAVTITVTAVDDPPNASDFSKSTDEDTTLTFAAADFTDAFSDADGDTLKSVKIATLPDAAHGTLKAGDPLAAVSTGDTIAAADLGTLSFEPVANWNGEASFTFKVTDSNSEESAVAATVTITVSAVDDAPTASDISKTVNEDTPLAFAAVDFTGAFSDADGHTLKSVEIATLPDAAHGTLKAGDPLAAVSTGDTIAAADLGTLSFEPVANWNGEASFTFKVTDSNSEESAVAATVTITVSAVDDAPTASNFGKSIDEDTTLTFAASDFISAFSDADGDTLKSVKIATLPNVAHGTLKVGLADASTGQVVLAANLGTISFESVGNWNGTASFTFKVTDSNDDESAAAATVSITVGAVDDAPTASDISKTINEGTTLTFAAADFTGAFSDADGHTLKSVKIVTLPSAAHGTLKVGAVAASIGQVVLAANLGTIAFEPATNWNGEASFTFKVTDSEDEESTAAATVTITVTAVDDPPTASNFGKSIDEDTTLTFAASDFISAFSDADGDTLKSVKIVTLPDAAPHARHVSSATRTSALSFEPPTGTGRRFTFTSSTPQRRVDRRSGRHHHGERRGRPPTAAKTSDTTLTFAASDFERPDGDTPVEIATGMARTGRRASPSASSRSRGGDGPTRKTKSDRRRRPPERVDFSKSTRYRDVRGGHHDVTRTPSVKTTLPDAAHGTLKADRVGHQQEPVASRREDTTLTFAASDFTPLAFAAVDFTGAFSDADGDTLKSVKIATELPDLQGRSTARRRRRPDRVNFGSIDDTAGSRPAQRQRRRHDRKVGLAADLGTLSFEPALPSRSPTGTAATVAVGASPSRSSTPQTKSRPPQRPSPSRHHCDRPPTPSRTTKTKSRPPRRPSPSRDRVGRPRQQEHRRGHDADARPATSSAPSATRTGTR